MSDTAPQGRLAWDRREGEPARWYARFEAYRLAGPSRSYLATYNAERSKRSPGRPQAFRVPSSWRAAAQKWEWQARAEAWDAEAQACARASHEQDREEDHRLRLEILKAFRVKLVQALQKLDPASADWRDVSAGLLMVNREIRLEMGEDPDGIAGPLDITLHWADVPPELQKREPSEDSS